MTDTPTLLQKPLVLNISEKVVPGIIEYIHIEMLVKFMFSNWYFYFLHIVVRLGNGIVAFLQFFFKNAPQK